ncbi:hypothetical protein [Hydrogenophaga sp. PBC]|uniref:hypothetical protein n=1 Tax=Hydrogenophaga sp. PBC TaxID=795665 RepID=UPI000260887A|nr:hypothetical protein [Hydrogenophaga sp. PBC]
MAKATSSNQKKSTRTTAPKKATSKRQRAKEVSPPAKYPRHAVEKSLRIPRAILEQNAGRACSVKEAAAFLGLGAAGPFQVEVSSGIKYGFLDRPEAGHIQVTERAKQIIRPQDPEDKLRALRDAVLSAPIISDVYGHYRGEHIPDSQFFHNALVDSFGIPPDKIAEFEEVFLESLRSAQLIAESDGKYRLIDITSSHDTTPGNTATFKKLDKAVKVDSGDSCFVMMPFASPHGDYYSKIYKPAIEKAGLRPVRADTEIFGTGKIIDQIWGGINASKVLVAELTTRNPNVFYELGLAHALEKPVVLVCGNEMDVPFDLKHIRVIYYDTSDPFWGNKLMDKVAENILSAIANPNEAVLQRVAE